MPPRDYSEVAHVDLLQDIMADPLLEIETAFSKLQMCKALAQDADRLVANAIDWYTCVKPELSPQLVRRQPKLIRQAVGDYLYIAGCNLAVIVESLPEHCNQNLISQVAREQVSTLVDQQYPDLFAAMKRAFTKKKTERTGTKTNFAAYGRTAQATRDNSPMDVTHELM